MKSLTFAAIFTLFFLAGFSQTHGKQSAKIQKVAATNDTLVNSALVNGLKFRSIGPAWASGRIADFAVNTDNPSEYIVGVASGNVWKTNNNGITWEPIFDSYGAYSIGVVKLDPNNPNVIWVGTGENNHQRALGYGDGVYKSLDGGKSFKNMGLKDSRQIGGIVIDPRNSNTVFVACEGSAWGPGGERGLYKTTDGGTTWKKTLDISVNTGINNLVMDPSNPDILYATSEQRRRHHYGKIGGGPESAVYKSTDNGETWRKIMTGLPSVDIGGMGIDVSPANPNFVYLIVEAQGDNSGFYRSENKGESWEKMSSHFSSGQYYNEIFCDPKNENKVFSVETFSFYTEDGGKTWKQLSNNNRHVDDHALWINPENTNHLLIGGDGGIYESYDMGAHWDFKENLPITQFYRVAVDNAEPFYNVYGGTQDNNSMGGPSQNINRSGVTNDEWYETLGGDGFWQAIDPTDPNIVYSEYQYGNIYRYDKRSGERISIKPRERKGEEAYKWNWNTPLIISPHSNTRLYCAANKVFRSDDRGQSWLVISDDLTAQVDRNSLPIMDKFWSADAVVKHVSTSQWGTIVSFDESRIKEGLLFVGTDDGIIATTEDGGKSWNKVNSFPGVPEYTYVSDIQADKFDANTVYATFDNLKRDDFKPYALKSSDKGRTWVSIAGNLPNHTVHSIQQDYKNPNLLFAGTEFGIFFTTNGGKHWVQLKSGIPTIAVRDIAIQEPECDLVLATFGRGFYILDNYSPLRDVSVELADSDAKLFPIKDALSYVQKSSRDNQGSTYFFAKNPDYGATITYYLKDVPKTKKEIRHEKEKELFKKGELIPQPTWRELELEGKEEKPHLVFTITDKDGNLVNQIIKAPSKGINRLSWGLTYPSITPVSTDKFDPTKETRENRPVMPGSYSVKMEMWMNGKAELLAGPVSFQVKKLNIATLPATDMKELEEYNGKFANMIATTEGAERLIVELTRKVEIIKQTLYNSANQPATLMNEARQLSAKLEEINFKMQGVPAKASWEEIPPAQIPVSVRVSDIAWARYASTGAVTQTEKDGYAIVKTEFVPILEELAELATVKIPAMEKELDKLNAPWTPDVYLFGKSRTQ
jgi:photosystem II stability/assembly factor-like uncharacterized protein